MTLIADAGQKVGASVNGIREVGLRIRPARPGEAGLVLGFVRELAEYEKLTHEVDATEAMIDSAVFGSNPRTY